jgi:HK97 family phage portal protein
MALLPRIRAGLASFFSGPVAGDKGWDPADDRWYMPVSMIKGGGESPQSALQIGAVYACTKLLSETLGMLPMHLYRRRADKGVEKAIEHPLYRLLHRRPNTIQTAIDFVMWSQSTLLLRGVTYSRKIFDYRGRLKWIVPLNPDVVTMDIDESGALIYRTYEKGVMVTLKQSEVFRIQSFTLSPLEPLSVVGLARSTLQQVRHIAEFGSKMFENHARPGGIFTHPGKLSELARKRLETDWSAKFAGPQNARRTAFLEEGMKWQPITMTAEDVQFIDAQRATVPEICRWFGVPPHMVGDLSRSTFSNIEHQSLEFVKHSLGPWIAMWEQAIARDLLTEDEQDEYFVKISVEGLLRGDSEARAKFYSAAAQTFLTINEIRELEDRDSIEGGDRMRVPVNTAPLGSQIANGDRQAATGQANDNQGAADRPRQVPQEPPRQIEPPRRRRAAEDDEDPPMAAKSEAADALRDRVIAFTRDAARRVLSRELRDLERAMAKRPSWEGFEAWANEFGSKHAAFRREALHIRAQDADAMAQSAVSSYRVICERVGPDRLGEFILANLDAIIASGATSLVEQLSSMETVNA